MDELFDPATLAHLAHLRRDDLHLILRDTKTVPVLVYKILELFDLGHVEERSETAVHVEENIHRMRPDDALLFEATRIALKNMRLVGPDPENLILLEIVHAVACDQRARTAHDPGQLNLVVPVQIRIEMRKALFLDDDRFGFSNRQREFEDLNHK